MMEKRAVIALRSLWFRELRREGIEPAAPAILDAACSIAAVPPDREPPAALIERLIEAATPPAKLPPSERLTHRDHWELACLDIVALGRPDGRPLRHAIAEGKLANARAIVDRSRLQVLLPPPFATWPEWLAASSTHDSSVIDFSLYNSDSPIDEPLRAARNHGN